VPGIDADVVGVSSSPSSAAGSGRSPNWPRGRTCGRGSSRRDAVRVEVRVEAPRAHARADAGAVAETWRLLSAKSTTRRPDMSAIQASGCATRAGRSSRTGTCRWDLDHVQRHVTPTTSSVSRTPLRSAPTDGIELLSSASACAPSSALVGTPLQSTPATRPDDVPVTRRVYRRPKGGVRGSPVVAGDASDCGRFRRDGPHAQPPEAP
jgi:hypothetical protein